MYILYHVNWKSIDVCVQKAFSIKVIKKLCINTYLVAWFNVCSIMFLVSHSRSLCRPLGHFDLPLLLPVLSLFHTPLNHASHHVQANEASWWYGQTVEVFNFQKRLIVSNQVPCLLFRSLFGGNSVSRHTCNVLYQVVYDGDKRERTVALICTRGFTK